MLSSVIFSKMKVKGKAWTNEATEKCWSSKMCRLTFYYVFQMAFINSGVPKSRRGISFVLCCQLLHCIAEKCNLCNNIIIGYISNKAPSTLKPMLDFVLHKVIIRKGSFGWQLMLWQMEKREWLGRKAVPYHPSAGSTWCTERCLQCSSYICCLISHYKISSLSDVLCASSNLTFLFLWSTGVATVFLSGICFLK